MRYLVVGGGPDAELSHVFTDYDYIIGVDRGAYYLANISVKMTLAIGDFDSVTHDEYQQISKCAEEIQKFPAEKDDTDFQAALKWIIAKSGEVTNELSITVTGFYSDGRMDHFVSNMWLAWDPRFNSLIDKIHVQEKNHRIDWYKPGNHVIVKQNDVRYVSIISFGSISCLEIKDAKYNLQPTDIDQPIAYISNEFIEDSEGIKLSFYRGLIGVMLVKDDHPHIMGAR